MDPFLDEADAPKTGLDPLMLLRAFWRRRLLFFVPFLLCLAMAWVAIQTMPPIYASVGEIEIRMNHLRSTLLADPSSGFGRQRDLAREIQNDMTNLLTSPQFLYGVAREMDLVQSLRARAAAAGEPMDEDAALRSAERRLRRKIRLSPQTKTIFEIEVRDSAPEAAHRLATLVTNRFVEEYRLARLAVRSSTREFLETQQARYEEDLVAAEAELNRFLTQEATNDMLNNPLHAGNIAETEEKLIRIRTRHEGPDAVEFNQLAESARRILNGDPSVSVFSRDGVVRSLLLELEDLGDELMITPETDRDFPALETQLGRLRVQLNNRVEELVAINHPAVGIMDRNRLVQYYYSFLYRSSLLVVLREAQRQVEEYRRFVTAQPAQSARLAELQSEVENTRQLVATLEQEITEQRMNLEAGLSDVGLQISVRRQPLLIPFAVEPNVMRLAFMGFLLSLGLGTGLVVLAIVLDRSFRSVDEIEHVLGLRVVGTLPLIQDEHFNRKRRLRLLRWVTIVLMVLAVAAVGFLVVYPMLNM